MKSLFTKVGDGFVEVVDDVKKTVEKVRKWVYRGDGFVEVVDDVKKTVEKVHVHGFIEEPPPDPDIESEQ